MTIIGIHGYLGSGKTLIAVLIVLDYLEKGYYVISNSTLKNIQKDFQDRIRPMDIDEILALAIYGKPFLEELKPDYKGLVIFGDEWEMYMDSRASPSKVNIITSYMLIQSRKRKIKWIYTAPKRGMNDNRVRDLTNLIISCEKRHKTDRRICFKDECYLEHYFNYYIIDTANLRGKKFTLKNAKDFYELFETEQIISPYSNINEEDIEKGIKRIG